MSISDASTSEPPPWICFYYLLFLLVFYSCPLLCSWTSSLFFNWVSFIWKTVEIIQDLSPILGAKMIKVCASDLERACLLLVHLTSRVQYSVLWGHSTKEWRSPESSLPWYTWRVTLNFIPYSPHPPFPGDYQKSTWIWNCSSLECADAFRGK